MEQIALLSAVTAIIAFDIADSALFEPVRRWLKCRSRFVGELVSCGYCVGHWIALGLTLVYRPHILVLWWPLDIFLTSLVVAWLSAFQWLALCWLFARVGK
jgi:hypothetical protein